MSPEKIDYNKEMESLGIKEDTSNKKRPNRIFKFEEGREYKLQYISREEVDNPFPKSTDPNYKYMFLDLDLNKEFNLTSVSITIRKAFSYHKLQPGDKFTIRREGEKMQTKHIINRLDESEAPQA